MPYQAWCLRVLVVKKLFRFKTSSSRRTRTLGRDNHDIARGLAGGVVICRRLVELHGEAVVFREAIRGVAERQLDPPRLHPDLLMDAQIARAGFVGHSRASRQ